MLNEVYSSLVAHASEGGLELFKGHELLRITFVMPHPNNCVEIGQDVVFGSRKMEKIKVTVV